MWGGWLSALALVWQFAGWYGGGQYPALVADPNVRGRLYLTSDVAGIWRSDDRGDHWTFSNSGLTSLNIATMAVSPSDSRVVYAGMKTGLARSTNGGASWAVVPMASKLMSFTRPYSYRAIAVSKNNPKMLYVGTKDGTMFRTSDGGATWGQLGPASGLFGAKVVITAIALNGAETAVFAGSSRGLVRVDGTTGAVASLIDGVPVQDLLVLPGQGTLCVTQQATLACSSDEGQTWQRTQPIPAGHITRIAAAGHDQTVQWLVASYTKGKAGLYLSTDDGHTWTSIKRNLRYDVPGNPTRAWLKDFQRPNAVVIDPFDPAVFYYTDTWGVWRSDDGGASWQEKIRGAPNASGSDLHISADGTMFVATMDEGLLKSTDGGHTYVAAVPGQGLPGIGGGHVWRVASSEKGTRVIATGSLWTSLGPRAFISRDAGTTFTMTTAGLPNAPPTTNTVWGQGYARGLAMDPTDPTRVYLGIDGDHGGGFFTSTDGGQTWSRPSSQPSSRKIYNGLAVDPTAPSRIFWGVCGASGIGVYRSSDYGASWEPSLTSAMPCVFDVAISATGDVYAAGVKGTPALFISRDHGMSWTELKRFASGQTCEAIAIDPSDPSHLAVGVVQWGEGSGGQIWHSADGGKAWTDLTAGLPENSGPAAMAFDPRRQRLYVLLYAGSVYSRSVQ